MNYIKSKEVAVLVVGPFNEPFDYLLNDNSEDIRIGQIVEVPFGNRSIVGIIVSQGSGRIQKEK